MRSVAEVKQDHLAELMAMPGVVGVGVAHRNSRPVLKVFVRDMSSCSSEIPGTIEGYDVEVEEVGDITT